MFALAMFERTSWIEGLLFFGCFGSNKSLLFICVCIELLEVMV